MRCDAKRCLWIFHPCHNWVYSKIKYTFLTPELPELNRAISSSFSSLRNKLINVQRMRNTHLKISPHTRIIINSNSKNIFTCSNIYIAPIWLTRMKYFFILMWHGFNWGCSEWQPKTTTAQAVLFTKEKHLMNIDTHYIISNLFDVYALRRIHTHNLNDSKESNKLMIQKEGVLMYF